MTNPALPLLDELAAIKAYLGAAIEVVRDGYMPDMALIEKRIATLCLGIQAAEFETQNQCLPALAGLLKSLDDCERGMRAWKESQSAAPSTAGEP